ncbi:hypothetical protein LTR08_007751 [Meristemomyces frigidus]|nr:hypothetical protein LTR08_007751 [Meristemomyces frigidus]
MSSDEERPAKRARIHFEDTIPVQVGGTDGDDPTTVFYVPRNLIRARSTFFNNAVPAACPNNGKTETVSLDAAAEKFSSYLHVLHTGEVLSLGIRGVYILAHRLGDFVSANLIMDKIFRNMKNRRMDPHTTEPSRYASVINQIYKSTTEGSPLRRIMSTYMAFAIKQSRFHDRVQGLGRQGSC